MIGKTLYKAKVKDGKVIMEEKTIVSTKRIFHYFDKNDISGVPKRDVGVTCFLTKKEAIDYLIKNIQKSIKQGENYLAELRRQLDEALNFPEK